MNDKTPQHRKRLHGRGFEAAGRKPLGEISIRNSLSFLVQDNQSVLQVPCHCSPVRFYRNQILTVCIMGVIGSWQMYCMYYTHRLMPGNATALMIMIIDGDVSQSRHSNNRDFTPVYFWYLRLCQSFVYSFFVVNLKKGNFPSTPLAKTQMCNGAYLYRH